MLSWLGPVRDLLGNLLIKHSFVTFVRPEAAMETKLMWQLLMNHCHKGNLSKLMDLLLLFSGGQQWNSLAGSLFHPDAVKVLDWFVLGIPQQVCPLCLKTNKQKKHYNVSMSQHLICHQHRQQGLVFPRTSGDSLWSLSRHHVPKGDLMPGLKSY